MKTLREKLKDKFRDREYAHIYAREFLNAYIATQIKVLREQQELTQTGLAELAGMKQSRISALEDINYSMWSISTLQKLAEQFDLVLSVSFERFSKRIGEIQGFSRESLERTSRDEDLTEMDTSLSDASVASLLVHGTPGITSRSVNLRSTESDSPKDGVFPIRAIHGHDPLLEKGDMAYA